MNEKQYCVNCGKELSKDDKFCQNCGNSVIKEKQVNFNKQDSSGNKSSDKTKISTNESLNNDKKKKNNSDNIEDNDILRKITTGLNTVVSALFTGLSQIYNREVLKEICIVLFILGLLFLATISFLNTWLISASYYEITGMIYILILIIFILLLIIGVLLLGTYAVVITLNNDNSSDNSVDNDQNS